MVYSVLFIGVWPMIEFMTFYSLSLFLRLVDRGGLCRTRYSTKKNTIQQYVDLYGGPEYQMHWKYSNMMNVVWVAMIFGPGVPMLYPCACFTFIVNYIDERLCLAYYFKQPPNYDHQLSLDSIEIMKWAVPVNLFISFWMFSNQQIFTNHVHPVVDTLANEVTGHTLSNGLDVIPAWPCLVVGIIVTLYLTYQLFRNQVIKKYFPSLLKPEITIVEDLPPFTRALREEDRTWLIEEETHM